MDRWSWRLGVAGVVLGLLVGCAPRGGPPAAPRPVASAAPSPAAASVGASSAAEGGDASAVAAFYRGKTVRIVVGLSPGGGYDLTSRLLARYMAARIPGNPTMIVENRPGAG